MVHVWDGSSGGDEDFQAKKHICKFLNENFFKAHTFFPE
jgi:hypothetical protein